MQVAITASPAPITTATTPKNFSMPVNGPGCLHITRRATATSSKSAPKRYHRGNRARSCVGGAGGCPAIRERTPDPQHLGSGDDTEGAADFFGRFSISTSNFRPMTGFGTKKIYSRILIEAIRKWWKRNGLVRVVRVVRGQKYFFR
jgi:hypothetical protein